MKQVYIAASWSRRDEAREVAEELELINIYVKADWLYAKSAPKELHDKHCTEMGYTDIRNIRDCDVFVRLADDLEAIAANFQTGLQDYSDMLVPSHLATGARMFEQGLAYGLGKEIYVVGKRQMLFDYMPRVSIVKDKLELMNALCPLIQ